jgi:hypothetical protein
MDPRSRRRRLLAGLAVGALAVMAIGTGMVTALLDDGSRGRAGASVSATATVSPGDQRRAAVSEVLAALNAALDTGDEKAFTALTDPQAPAAFRQHQATVFRGMHGLHQLASFRYSWPGESWFGVPSAQTGLSSDAFVAAVSLTYSFTGFDRSAVTDVVGLTLNHRNGHWYIRSDSDANDQLALGGQLEPWSVGDISVAEHGRAIVIGDPQHRTQNVRLAKRLDSALSSVRDMWPVTSWNGRVVAYASTYKPFVTAWFGTHAATNRKVDPSGDATFEAKVRVLPGNPVVSNFDDFTPAAPRLVVTPYLLTRDDTYTQAVLRHELTHVALALEGSDRPPAWLVEGAAEYTGFRAVNGKTVDGVEALAQRGLRKDTWAQLKRGTWKPSLVAADDTFYAGSEIAVDNNYTTAWFTCLYIADHYGEAKLRALYAAAAKQPEGQTQEEVEAAVLKSVLHTDRATLVAATKSYARSTRSHFV